MPPDPQLARCLEEQRSAAQLLAAGHPEQRGLHQALFDQMAEAILRGDGQDEAFR